MKRCTYQWYYFQLILHYTATSVGVVTVGFGPYWLSPTLSKHSNINNISSPTNGTKEMNIHHPLLPMPT